MTVYLFVCICVSILPEPSARFRCVWQTVRRS